MSDDRWRDSYDTWKLATPPEYEITPEEEDRTHREAEEDRAAAIVMTATQQRRAIEIVRQLAGEWREVRHLDNESRAMDDLRNLCSEIAKDGTQPGHSLPPF